MQIPVKAGICAWSCLRDVTLYMFVLATKPACTDTAWAKVMIVLLPLDIRGVCRPGEGLASISRRVHLKGYSSFGSLPSFVLMFDITLRLRYGPHSLNFNLRGGRAALQDSRLESFLEQVRRAKQIFRSTTFSDSASCPELFT